MPSLIVNLNKYFIYLVIEITRQKILLNLHFVYPNPIAGLKFGIRSGSRTTALDAEMMETNLLFLLGLGERKSKHVDVLQRGAAREKIVWLGIV